MDTSEITEKEFRIITEISNNHQPNQRIIAQKTGFSLGLTNLLIKNLIKKGYIKASQLDKRKVQYILTPTGFTEKFKKSYKYTLQTIKSFKIIQDKIRELILYEYNKGNKQFIIQGDCELAAITEVVFHSMHLENLVYSKENMPISDDKKSFVVLTTDNFEPNTNKNYVNMINYLTEAKIDL